MGSSTMKADMFIDARGMSCIVLLLKTKKILKEMGAGKILEIRANDPGSRQDLPDLGSKNGNSFLGMHEADDGSTIYYIKKG